jgi:hypothetical protein
VTEAVLPVYEEELLIDWLLDQTAVTDLLSGARIYTVLPASPTFPIVRAFRIGGGPDSRLLWLDHPLIQFDVWGGAKAQARLIADTIRSQIAYGLVGEHELGTVTAVESVGGPRWLPDASYTPAKPRWSFDVTFAVHPPTP